MPEPTHPPNSASVKGKTITVRLPKYGESVTFAITKKCVIDTRDNAKLTIHQFERMMLNWLTRPQCDMLVRRVLMETM